MTKKSGLSNDSWLLGGEGGASGVAADLSLPLLVEDLDLKLSIFWNPDLLLPPLSERDGR